MADEAVNLSYPSNLQDKGMFPASIMFSFYDRTDPTSSHPSDKISLYMPERISQPSTVSWEAENFGFIGHSASQNLRIANDSGVVSAYRAAVNELTNQAGNMIGAALLKGVSDLATAGINVMGGNVTAESLLANTMGKIPNPYLTMIFKSVNFRTFEFVFSFFPMDEADCKNIYQILQTFRRNALPGTEGAGATGAQATGDDSMWLTYPKECEIKYMWKDKANPWLHKFKRAVCTAIDIDYTGSGSFTVMRNGFPTEIKMSTRWSEIHLVTRDEVSTDGESF